MSQVEPCVLQNQQTKINARDLTDVKSDGALAHEEFAQAPDVIRPIGERLLEGPALSDANPTFSDEIAFVTNDIESVLAPARPDFASPAK